MTFRAHLSTVTVGRLLLVALLAGFSLAFANVEAATISAPTDYLIPEGTVADVPITVTDAGDGIVGVDLVLQYNPQVIDITDDVVVTSGTATDGFFSEYNVVSVSPTVKELRISAASLGATLPTSGSATLLKVSFQAASTTGPLGSPLTLTVTELNESAVTGASGNVKLSGDTAVIALDPDPVKPSESLSLIVTDADRAGDGSVDVTVTSKTSGGAVKESYTLALSEQGSGTFTGTVTTSYGTNASAGDNLEVAPGDDIEIGYDDELDGDGNHPPIDPAKVDVVAGTDGVVSTSPARIDPGDDIAVKVEDADLIGKGSVSVTVTSRPTGDQVTVQLTETSSGVFEGMVKTDGSAGSLSVAASDLIEVDYDDAVGSTGAPRDNVGTVTPESGAFTVPATVLISEDLSISLTDGDLASTSATRVNGPITVTVTSKTGVTVKDVQTVDLTEGVLGTFTGSITTVYGESGDSGTTALEVEPGDVVTVSYDDPRGDGGGAVTIPSDEVTAVAGVDGVVSTSPARIDPGDDITVTVTDADLIGKGPISVTVTSQPTGDQVTVELTETPAGSGIFIGTVKTDGSAGSLSVAAGDLIEVDYDDAVGSTGAPRADVGTVTPESGSITVPSSVKVSEDLSISLTDGDLASPNATRVNGPISVTVTSKTGATTKDVQTVELTEGDWGTFAGSITTIYGETGDSGTTTLEVEPGDVVTVSYGDPRGDGGGAVTITSDNVAVGGGVTGTLDGSIAIQGGDGLRVELTDPDLTGTGSVTVSIKDTNLGGDELEVELTEYDPADHPGVFRAVPPVATSSDAVDTGDQVFQVSVPGVPVIDNIAITYLDGTPADGDDDEVTFALTGVIWGDTSANGKVGALDASQILQHSVNLNRFDAGSYQELVGDVDPGSPGITSWEASYVLQYAVGMITTFPVQTGTPVPHPYKRTVDERQVALGAPELEGGLLRLPVVVDELDGLLSGQLRIEFDPQLYRIASVATGEGMAGYMVASNVVDDALLIGFAGAQAASAGPGKMLQIRLEVLGGGSEAALAIEEVELNGGRIRADAVERIDALVQPQSFSLLQNWPNPFNPETTLRYTLPQAGPVTLEVFDMLGQKVRNLVREHQAVGAYEVQWDGRDDSGMALGSGIYFYQLEAGTFAQTRKMTLLR